MITIKVLINTPVDREAAAALNAGDNVEISGIIYTARDAAHKRMLENYDKDIALPIDLTNQIIYYAGPSPARPGMPVGSIGPTTAGRMDAYTPRLLDMGLAVMIGKGKRSSEVIDSMIKNKAVYIAAVGGAGALLASHVTQCSAVAYEDLGAEAIYRLKVERFPGIVVIDSRGNNLYNFK